MQLDDVQRAAQEQFAKQSHRYARGHILENTADVAAAQQWLTLPMRARVLDIATGAGHTGLFFAQQGHEVTLADIALPMLERAREGAERLGVKVELRQHAAEELPYADGMFDLVTSRVAPHHFTSPESFVRETARVLKPGGFFLLIDGSIMDNEPEAEGWLHQVEKLRDPSHHRLLSPGSWSALCRTAGMTVVHAELNTFKQPDLNWYFETAATSPANREAVLKLIMGASENVRRLFKLAEEDGKIVWWWPRLTLVARKG